MSFSINGLVSNLDTAKIVSDLMKLERIPYTTLETKKTNIQSEQTIFRNINTKLSALENAVNELRYNADFNAFTAKSSNANALTVTTTGNVTPGTYSISVDKMAQANVKSRQGIETGGTDLADALRTAAAGSVKINGKDIDLAAVDIKVGDNNEAALRKLTNYINANSATYGVTASTLTTDGKGEKMAFSLKANVTGAESNITITGLPGSFTDAVTAQDAELTLNGVKVNRSTNKIDDLIAGASVQLVGEGQKSTVTLGQDTDKIAGKVEAFVNAYNELITLVKDNLSKPSDKTKMNPLQGDSTLKGISDGLYNMVTGIVGKESGFKMLSQIGLTIDEGIVSPSQMTGKISFNKEVFKAKLGSNPDEVKGMFVSDPKAEDPASEEPQGVMAAMGSVIRSQWTSSINGSLSMKISGYDSELKVIDERMESLDARLLMREARLKSQFATMETMLSSLKSQQDWLTSQFDSLAKSNK
jgi:flagellar hook-associated protein 2